MKTLYVDAGRWMTEQALAGALLELMPETEAFVRELNEAGIPCHAEAGNGPSGLGTAFTIRPDTREPCAIPGGIGEAMSHIRISRKARQDVLGVFQILTDAYQAVWGLEGAQWEQVCSLSDVFAVAAVCVMIERLSPDQILFAPVGVSDAYGDCDRETAVLRERLVMQMMQGCPVRMDGGGCTPAAAAVARYFAAEAAQMPVMRLLRWGRGQGNGSSVRAVWGETEQLCQDVVELSCNVDDMTAEAIGFALEQFLAEGAVEAYTVPIGMKKSRPGVKVSVLCRPEQRERMVHLILKHTTTLGVRESGLRRYTMSRSFRQIQTPYGTVCRKDSIGYGVSRSKYEYEDLAKIAREQGLSLENVRAVLEKADKSPSER